MIAMFLALHIVSPSIMSFCTVYLLLLFFISFLFEMIIASARLRSQVNFVLCGNMWRIQMHNFPTVTRSIRNELRPPLIICMRSECVCVWAWARTPHNSCGCKSAAYGLHSIKTQADAVAGSFLFGTEFNHLFVDSSSAFGMYIPRRIFSLLLLSLGPNVWITCASIDQNILLMQKFQEIFGIGLNFMTVFYHFNERCALTL